MKSYLPLLITAALLASCSSAYRSGQTPDDVYFSPERQRDEYVRVEQRDDRMYQNEELDREDRYLRMKARNRRYGLLENDIDWYAYNGGNYYRYNDYYRMNRFAYNHNWWMWNNGYAYGHYNPYYFNPHHASPYYSGIVYGNVNPYYNKPRNSNLHVFDRNGNTNNPNAPRNNGRTFGNSRNNDNYRGSGDNAGGFMRDVFGGGSNNNSSNAGKTSTNNSNNNNNSNSGNNNSSSSGSSRAPVRKF